MALKSSVRVAGSTEANADSDGEFCWDQSDIVTLYDEGDLISRLQTHEPTYPAGIVTWPRCVRVAKNSFMLVIAL